MNSKTNSKGFTLIELLVVIAVIAMLMSVILPCLTKAKEAAARTVCLSNQKSLASLWMIFAYEHDDKVLSGYPVGLKIDDEWAWVNYYLDSDKTLRFDDPDDQILGIKQGVLYQYCESIDIFSCPVGKKDEKRTYSMPDSFCWQMSLTGKPVASSGVMSRIGGDPDLIITKQSQIKRAEGQMLWIDEGYSTKATWSIPYDRWAYWDPIPLRHNNGTTFSFADGHSEYWKWEDQRTMDFALKCVDNPGGAHGLPEADQEGNPEPPKIVKAVWGKVGYPYY